MYKKQHISSPTMIERSNFSSKSTFSFHSFSQGIQTAAGNPTFIQASYLIQEKNSRQYSCNESIPTTKSCSSNTIQ